MRFWTSHLRPGKEPVLVKEGFSWGALLFGPLWLLAHRAWTPAALALAAGILILALTTGAMATALELALTIWLGLSGNDLRRWALQRRGFALFQVVAGRNEAEAFERLLARSPGLAERLRLAR